MDCVRYICLFLLLAYSKNEASTQETYRATVMEFHPLIGSTPNATILENVRKYEIFIDSAGQSPRSDIIVFPEDGLTGTNISAAQIFEFSTIVPEGSENVVPCDQRYKYSKALQDLSCAAKQNEIYVVVNLVERSQNSDNQTIYYNTNVVFDREGRVIEKYRKINLFYESLFTPGNEIKTFKTDFGVTFGLFTCFDILFKNPAMDILKDESVTDIIYPVAWFSEAPFLQALSVQAGYAKSNGVNLLAAGYNDPSNKNGGSGIYLANGTIGAMEIRPETVSMAIPSNVPKITKRQTNQHCQVPKGRELSSLSSPGNIITFPTLTENMENYTFVGLTSNESTHETVCSEGSNFCCTFDIVIDPTTVAKADYFFKMVAFYGVRRFGEVTAGIRVCGLVACLDPNDNKSCGMRKNTATGTNVKFLSISINGTFDGSSEIHNQPATLRYDLKPIDGYSYCEETIDGSKVNAKIVTKVAEEGLLTFGIFGRVYSDDGLPPGKGGADFVALNAIMMLLACVIFILN